MARRRARLQPERGWFIDGTEFTVAATAVDNITTVVEPFVSFDQLTAQDDDSALSGQDRRSEYYIEATRGFFASVATFGLGNELGALPIWWGMFIGDNAIFNDIAASLAPGLAQSSVPFEDFRASQFVRQVVSVHIHLAASNYFPGERIDQGQRPWFEQWSTGPIHLKRGESLYWYGSQSGNTSASDPFQPWVDGDQVACQFVGSALIRKKRGS